MRDLGDSCVYKDSNKDFQSSVNDCSNNGLWDDGFKMCFLAQ